jgi:hypothetical protein
MACDSQVLSLSLSPLPLHDVILQYCTGVHNAHDLSNQFSLIRQSKQYLLTVQLCSSPLRSFLQSLVSSSFLGRNNSLIFLHLDQRSVSYGPSYSCIPPPPPPARFNYLIFLQAMETNRQLPCEFTHSYS